MKTMFPVLLLVLPLTSFAQEKLQNVNAPDLLVIESKLVAIQSVDATGPGSPSMKRGGDHFDFTPPSYEWKGKAQLTIRNTGDKNIRRVDWDFFLTDGSHAEKTTWSYSVHGEKVIKPGETVTLIGWIKDASLKQLRRPLKKGQLQGRAEVKRVDYAGGRIWMPLKAKPKNTI
jgi:hypothetical protein